MAVDFISSCFSTNYISSSNNIEDYFEDFSIKNSYLPIQVSSNKYNRNFLDKLFLLRFSFYEKIQTSRALCNQDEGKKKALYSILAIPSLMLDFALNEVLYNCKKIYSPSLVLAIGVNLLYKKIIHGKNFEYSSSIQSYFHTLFHVVALATILEFITVAFNTFFLNKDPFSVDRKSWVPMEIPVALFYKEDGTYTTAFSKARYSSAWKNHSDEQIYEMLKETCPKFRYSVKGDKIRVYLKVGYSEVVGFVASLKKSGSA